MNAPAMPPPTAQRFYRLEGTLDADAFREAAVVCYRVHLTNDAPAPEDKIVTVIVPYETTFPDGSPAIPATPRSPSRPHAVKGSNVFVPQATLNADGSYTAKFVAIHRPPRSSTPAEPT